VNVVDSSGWLEYFADGPNAGFFAAAIENTAALVVPTISLYEVYKRVLDQRDDRAALQVVGVMLQAKVVELSAEVALAAAKVGLAHALPMADALILTTAQAHGAILWTQDVDFAHVPGVRYRAKRA
jgi:toxin FitB